MKFSELKVGQSAKITKTITAQDVETFSLVSLDTNPVHLDQEYAKNTIFKKRIAHGILSAGLISAVLANHLPGAGCIYLGQDLKFLAPVYLDDTITAQVEITQIREDKRIVTLLTTCTNQDGKQVITGTATVLHNVD